MMMVRFLRYKGSSHDVYLLIFTCICKLIFTCSFLLAYIYNIYIYIRLKYIYVFKAICIYIYIYII